ncbi:hypothetical protein ZIOFF_029552 [Zingiber officinale]|uniref:Uncharacterized protein n=1 Tax=Zingiber officinale TaxID=94328 RepID=A0A8J5LAZ5_ZINOF|nr:hypothetical protein ZIOFF_029552 [Zingiber officinale]
MERGFSLRDGCRMRVAGTEPAKEEKQGNLERRSEDVEEGGLEDVVKADWPMQGSRSGARRRRRCRQNPEASSLTFLRVRSHHALIVANGLLRPGAPSPTGRPSAARGFSLPPPPLRLGDPRGGGTPIPACCCIGRRRRAGLVLWRPQGHTSLEGPTWNSVEPASRLQAVEGCGRGDPEGHRTHQDAHQAHSSLRQSLSVELQLEAKEIIGSWLGLLSL